MNKYCLSLVILLVTFQAIAQALPYPQIKHFKKFNLTPGDREELIPLSDGSSLMARVHIPNADSFDLIIGLHWAIGANRYDDFMNCLVLPAVGAQNYMVMAPLAEYKLWWESPRDIQLIKMIRLAKKYFPVRKVFVLGYSDGGTGSIHLMRTYPRDIDGIVALAASHDDTFEPEKPSYVVHGTEDELFAFDQVDQFMTQSKSDMLKYIRAKGRSHFEACQYVNYLKEGLDWLQQQYKD